MQCPVCDEKMKEVDRSGVMVDICPGCKGVWLDRGELDKLISLSEGQQASAAPERPEAPRERPLETRRPEYDERERHGDHRDDRTAQDGHGRRKGSLLADILECVGGD